MRRQTGASVTQEASGGSPLGQPSLAGVGISRPHTAAPASAGAEGSWPARQQLKQQQAGEGGLTEFGEAIREEPGGGGAGAGGQAPEEGGGSPADSSASKAKLATLPASPSGRIRAARPFAALPTSPVRPAGSPRRSSVAP